MRLFALPFDSVLTTRTRPTSAVERTWVPPSACLSMPSMSMIRIGSTEAGIRFTFVRIRSGSASASARGRTRTWTGRSSASRAFSSSSTSLPNPFDIESSSKSIRPMPPDSMLPPVTFAPNPVKTTPDSACSAVWVRMCMWRRSQSIVAVTAVPAIGGGPSITWSSFPVSREVRVSVTVTSPPSQESAPESPGWPPPRG